jgi:CRP/FNR family transcriptional regulator
MHNILQANSCQPVDAKPLSQQADVRNRLRLRVAAADHVFRAGDERHVYRVESGAVCHFSARGEGRFSVIEFAFAGDIVGLGHLPMHSSTAVAMVDTTVALLSPSELERAASSDDRVSYMLADAGERDFDFLRAQTVEAAPLAPVRRLANYLLAALGATRGERGAGELIIPDDIASGFVAEQLHMSVDTLAMALLSLRRSGAVDASARGLRVVDVGRLEMVADAA